MQNTIRIPLESRNDLTQYFIDLIEAKDMYTQGHSHHVHIVVQAIYKCLAPEYQIRLNSERLFTAALLHDIGKVMIPDSVLNKNGALDNQEWSIMRQHPQNGKKVLQNTTYADIGDWVLYHHERVDGRGYYGLPGGEIPLESRIIAVADTFSALRTYRIYRPAKSIGDTIAIMRECAGTQLDADIVEQFLCIDEVILEKLECNCAICAQRRADIEAQKAAGAR